MERLPKYRPLDDLRAEYINAIVHAKQPGAMRSEVAQFLIDCLAGVAPDTEDETRIAAALAAINRTR